MSSPTSTYPRPTVLITGASTGIGLELARLFASGGASAKHPAITSPYDLILLARTRPRLTEVAERLAAEFGVAVQIVTADLSHPKAPEEVFAYLNETGTRIDVLVNNAGFGANGNVAVLDLQLQLEMIQTNVTSLVHLTKLFLPQIIQRRGKIMNVASTAAFQPGPHMAVYYASKAFVLSFSEALAEEVAPLGVTVSTLCPGPTRTEFQERAGIKNTPMFKGPFTMDAAPVALEGFQGLMKGKRLVIAGPMNKMMVQSLRLSPRRLVTKISGKVAQQK
jgi:short-subunit dehydrogenase